MKTKNIFKALALAMLMPAMLLTTACSNEDDALNNTANTENTINKGYALPVTVNVTRQGDATTRATYKDNGDGTGSLGFSAGDKLFVSGTHTTAGKFAGALDYVPATGKFSGTIYTQNDYDGTADALFSAAFSRIATLLPNGYDSYNFLSISNNNTPDVAYDDVVSASTENAFVASETAKATGVEQLSCEQAYTYSSGFALEPANAVLNFTISGLEAGAKTVTLITKYSGMDYDQNISGSVTPNASGVATFAIGVPNNLLIKNVANNLTVGSSKFTLPGGTALTAGKIYNITRCVNAINGKFSVASGKQVYFSKGNLQYQASTGTWRFAEHQYDYVGNAAGNNTSSDRDTQSGWIDLFGWGTSGKSFASGYGSAYQPWKKSTTSSYYGPTGTNNLTGTYANGDWGVNMGFGWRTLTGNNSGEWNYLFNTRTVNGGQGSGHSYTKGQKVNNVLGVVLYPDDYTGAAYTTGANWSTFESAGCVFLPAAGWRNEATVNSVGSYGAYWSSTAYDTNNAHHLSFSSNSGLNNVNPTSYNGRSSGYSVRLVHDAN